MAKKTKKPRKFFVIIDGDLVVVNSKFFTVLNRQDAMMLGLAIKDALFYQLEEDSTFGYDCRVGTIKVTTGFLRSLDKLNEIFPFLFEEMKSYNSKTVFSS